LVDPNGLAGERIEGDEGGAGGVGSGEDDRVFRREDEGRGGHAPALDAPVELAEERARPDRSTGLEVEAVDDAGRSHGVDLSLENDGGAAGAVAAHRRAAVFGPFQE